MKRPPNTAPLREALDALVTHAAAYGALVRGQTTKGLTSPEFLEASSAHLGAMHDALEIAASRTQCHTSWVLRLSRDGGEADAP